MPSGQALSTKLSATQRVHSLTVQLMAEKQRERLGKAMRARRRELDLSPGYVAEALFISGKTLERWERGETMGAIRAVDQIAEVLDTTEELLLAGAPEEKKPTPTLFENGHVLDLENDLEEIRDELRAMKTKLDAEAALNADMRTQIKKLSAPAKRPAKRAK